MTKTLEKRFAQIGSQEDEKDPIVVATFFNPVGIGHWYATEYIPEEKLFFGYVSLFGDHNDEFGNFSLEELESVKGKLGLGIERDLYIGEKRLSEVADTFRVTDKCLVCENGTTNCYEHNQLGE